MAVNASWLNHAECAGEYIEAINVNMELCSASLGCPLMGDLYSEHLIPKRFKIVCDPSQNRSRSLPAHLLIILLMVVRVGDICVCMDP